jgi:uncharacterized protein DUF5681
MKQLGPNPKEKPMTFRPGQSGNPNGRPLGSRNKRTTLAERLRRDASATNAVNAAQLVPIVIALAGLRDPTALQVCMDIICPAKAHAPAFELPRMATAADAVPVMNAIVQGVSDGDLPPREAAKLARRVERRARRLRARHSPTGSVDTISMPKPASPT